MFLCLFRLILTALILLERSLDCSEFPEIHYAIYDGMGDPTSFLYANGWIETKCKAPSTNPTTEVLLKATLKNLPSIVLEQGNGSISFNVSLLEYDYEKIFCHSTVTGMQSNSKLEITFRLCDPMLLIPPITTCGDKEVCLKTADSISTCGKMSGISCDTSNQHQLKEKYICIQTSKPKTHQQGLCQATKTNTNNAQFSGITSVDNSCDNYENLKLNGKIVAEESIWFISITNKEFTSQFTEITRNFIEGRCQLEIAGGAFLLATGTPKNLTEVENQNTLVLPLDLSMIKRQSLPMKAKLICYVKTLLGSKTSSAYLFLFDNEQFKVSIIKTPIVGKDGWFSLNCSVALIDGILFTVAWDKEPDSYEDRNWMIKEVTNRFDDASKKHTCYAVGFAYQHPYKIKLLRLPGPSIKEVFEIERDIPAEACNSIMANLNRTVHKYGDGMAEVSYVEDVIANVTIINPNTLIIRLVFPKNILNAPAVAGPNPPIGNPPAANQQQQGAWVHHGLAGLPPALTPQLGNNAAGGGEPVVIVQGNQNHPNGQADDREQQGVGLGPG